MSTMITTTPANDNASAPLDAWAARVRDYHPAHAAASFACHRDELGAHAADAREITARSMVGKRWAKGDTNAMTYEQALAAIDTACAKRSSRAPHGTTNIESPMPHAWCVIEIGSSVEGGARNGRTSARTSSGGWQLRRRAMIDTAGPPAPSCGAADVSGATGGCCVGSNKRADSFIACIASRLIDSNSSSSRRSWRRDGQKMTPDDLAIAAEAFPPTDTSELASHPDDDAILEAGRALGSKKKSGSSRTKKRD